MGLGRFGGGLGLARWLAASGAEVFVTDLEPPERLAAPLAELDALVRQGRVTLQLGGHNISDFTTADLVVANPAVPTPWQNRYLRAAAAAGIPVTTEISLLAERLPHRRRVIGITGSVGKSTTSAMTACALKAAGERVVLGGNIGGSLLPRLHEIDTDTWVVLELSSAQLHWLNETLPGWAPAIAVVTAFGPNHLDWHASLSHYRASKEWVSRNQSEGDILVIGQGLNDWPGPREVRRLQANIPPDLPTLRVPGNHNRANAGAALAACEAALGPNLNREAALTAVGTFCGLPHRLCLIHEACGVRFFDDSKATTPEATLLAVQAFEADPGLGRVHLIVGGYDKGLDLSAIGMLADRLAGLYTIGATGPAIARHAGGRAVECADLAAAAARACEGAAPGSVVVLSPGCASWDQFENYEQRGDRFREIARTLTHRRGIQE